jgi:hypothetical protein
VGAEPWFNIVPYEEDVAAALQKERVKVFESGNYILTGRKKPKSIEEALERGGEEGTNSILDMTRVAKRRTDSVVAPLTPRTILKLFGTAQPTEKDWWDNYLAVWDELERGQGIFVVLYNDGQPNKIAFAGFGWD